MGLLHLINGFALVSPLTLSKAMQHLFKRRLPRKQARNEEEERKGKGIAREGLGQDIINFYLHILIIALISDPSNNDLNDNYYDCW